ncbi:MAG: CDP-alcohol phosphatidyltransferase family protein [Pyrinomonadaceae bacterium]
MKYLIPSALTLGSILCGWYVIIVSLKGFQDVSNPEHAALFFNHASQAIGLAIILDNLDGRVARMLGATTLFGIELDSIADALTFGSASAVLAYAWSIGSMPTMEIPAFGVTFLFVACGALRLARSNLHAHYKRSDEALSNQEDFYFVGLPIPAAAGMLAAMVHFSSSPIGGRLATGALSAEDARFYALLVIAVILLLSLLMVSTFSYSKLKIRPRGNKSLSVLNRLVFPLIVLMIATGVWFNSRWVVLILASLYVIHGPLLKFGQLLKR